MVWLSGYGYYKKGSVNATTAGAQINYQLELIVGESSGAGSVDVHCGAKCYDFPNDIRFTTEDGAAKHDYWVESITGTTPNRLATVMIEVASIPASGSVDFYMYYGLLGDSGESNGNNTFEFFDDFEFKLDVESTVGDVLVAGDVAKYEAWPGITKTANGDLFVVYRTCNTNTHGLESTGRAVVRKSTDNGQTWSGETIIADEVGKDDRVTNNLLTFTYNETERIICCYHIDTMSNKATSYGVYSDDHGVTWSTRKHIYGDATHEGHTAGQTILTSQNKLLVPVCVDKATSWGEAVFESSDGGDTWTRYNVAAINSGRNEFSIIETKTGGNYTGGIYAVFRRNDGTHFDYATSTDYGHTWSTFAEETELPVSTTTPCFLFRLSNGKILAAYTKLTKRLVIYETTDECSSWTYKKDVLTTQSIKYYAAITELSPSNLIFAWCENGSSSDVYINYVDYPLESAKWVLDTGIASVSNSILTLTANPTYLLSSAKKYIQPAKHVTCARFDNDDEQQWIATKSASGSDTNCELIMWLKYTLMRKGVQLDNTNQTQQNDAHEGLGSYHIYESWWKTDEVTFYDDNVLKATLTADVPTLDLYLLLRRSGATAFNIDWTFVSKYASPEPTWGAWGSQQCYGMERIENFYYAKIGDTVLVGLEKDSFRITEESNKIPSFEFEIANCSENRTAIAAGITDLFRIYSRICDEDTLRFTGLINSDAIEYLSLERIRITGYASYVDLNWRLHQHLNSEDAENVGKVYNYTGSYSDKTIAANNDTINDVPVTFTGVNHALYIGQSEQFFGMQVKYSTKGVQAANTTVVFEFSKGSGVWGTLDVLDETRAFTEDPGTYFITIPHKPSDWAKNTVNSVKKFWMRVRVTAGSYTTSPKLDRIKITNIDVCRVYYFETAANSIMDDVLEGTGYTMDAVDTCPSTEISIVAEYETKLRMIPGVANALTWDDSGDKKAYQWWVDTSKKVHFKQKRGATLGDITSELTILNNVEDYFNLTNRLRLLGNYDGLNQLRAVIENTDSQDTHKIRELAVPEERYNNYIPLKEAAQKAMTYTKAPLQKIAATVTTKYWLDNSFEVGDTVTLHKDTWNVDETAFQIVRADIGPRVTNIDMGISQEHLDGLKAGLQRQLDVSGIRMHGSTTLLQFGPETMNYQRVDGATVYPAKLKIEIPSDVRYIHKVLLSWTIGPYRASVGPNSSSVPPHTHGGYTGADGAHNHTGATGTATPHAHSFLEKETGDKILNHTHIIFEHDTAEQVVTLTHAIFADFEGYEGQGHKHSNPTTGSNSQSHTHTIPATDGPSDVANAVLGVIWNEWCSACNYWLVSQQDFASFATGSHNHPNTNKVTGGISQGHTHPQGVTGKTPHQHSVIGTIGGDLVNDLHAHQIAGTVSGGVFEVQGGDWIHAHTIPDSDAGGGEARAIITENAHDKHAITASETVDITTTYAIYEIAPGTTLELKINGEVIASNYVGDQSDIRIDGFLTTGTNSIEIQPIAGDNSKGGLTQFASGVVFIEARKF